MKAAAAQADLKGSVRLGNYLRRLRTGYGYSLRRVEERAKAEGGEIDNSQLSRYEKGICYPSFDKLRVLASVFNVSVQAFSDVVDLEEFQGLRPEGGDPELLIEQGNGAMRTGEPGRAFACYEKALEILAEEPAEAVGAARDQLVARGRVSLAIALSAMGKLSLAEQELRTALRSMERCDGSLRAKALLNLATLHADQGDLLLAELEAEKALAFARARQEALVCARALHVLAKVLAQRHEEAAAIERYQEAAQAYGACGDSFEALRVRINVAGCYVQMGKTREGIRLLRGALAEARLGGHRRLEAHAWSTMGEAHYRQGDRERAHRCFRESDAIASATQGRFGDLLFLNAYFEWKLAAEDGGGTREKIAFGRLKVLRSEIERRFPEVEAFDAYVERGRADA